MSKSGWKCVRRSAPSCSLSCGSRSATPHPSTRMSCGSECSCTYAHCESHMLTSPASYLVSRSRRFASSSARRAADASRSSCCCCRRAAMLSCSTAAHASPPGSLGAVRAAAAAAPLLLRTLRLLPRPLGAEKVTLVATLPPRLEGCSALSASAIVAGAIMPLPSASKLSKSASMIDGSYGSSSASRGSIDTARRNSSLVVLPRARGGLSASHAANTAVGKSRASLARSCCAMSSSRLTRGAAATACRSSHSPRPPRIIPPTIVPTNAPAAPDAPAIDRASVRPTAAS